MYDEEGYCRPKTIKEAVERFIELWDQQDIDLLHDCPKSGLAFLCANLEREVIYRCDLDEDNTDLLEACGSRYMKPEEASKVIVRALWADGQP